MWRPQSLTCLLSENHYEPGKRTGRPQPLERIQQSEKLSRREAAEYVARSDRGRYVKAHFHTPMDGDLQYHSLASAQPQAALTRPATPVTVQVGRAVPSAPRSPTELRSGEQSAEAAR